MNKHRAPYKSPSKSMNDIVAKWCNNNIETLGVAVITGVQDYPVDRTVDVQPLAQVKEVDGVEIEQPAITKCPVILQGSEDGFIHFPLNVGTKVIIGYPKRSIEEFTYSSTSDEYLPVDRNTFGSAQAIVLGYAAQAGGVDYSLSATDFEIRFKESRITLTESNTISMTNPSVTFEADSNGDIGLTNGDATLTMNSGGPINLTVGGVTFIMNSDGTFSLTGTADGTVNSCTITSGGNVVTAAGTDLDQLKADHDSLKTSYLAHGDGAPKHNPPVPAPV